MTAETELTTPNTKYPFFITVDASLVALGAVLFQMNEEKKMRVISYNSRILKTQEQKLSTLDRELLAIVYAVLVYEFLIIGSLIQYTSSQITNLHYTVLQKRETLAQDVIEHKCN